jgi:hypothetical protein
VNCCVCGLPVVDPLWAVVYDRKRGVVAHWFQCAVLMGVYARDYSRSRRGRKVPLPEVVRRARREWRKRRKRRTR